MKQKKSSLSSTEIKPTGTQIQKALVQYAAIKYPGESKLLVKIPNEGRRSLAYGRKMKDEGLRKGFPDLFFFKPFLTFCGLAIEVKGRGDTLKPEQREYIDLLGGNHYKAIVVTSVEQGMEAIDEVMRWGWNPPV